MLRKVFFFLSQKLLIEFVVNIIKYIHNIYNIYIYSSLFFCPIRVGLISRFIYKMGEIPPESETVFLLFKDCKRSQSGGGIMGSVNSRCLYHDRVKLRTEYKSYFLT